MPATVFQAFTKDLISSGYHFRGLVFNQTPKTCQGLPSWVRDWGSILRTPLGYGLQSEEHYKASGAIKANVYFSDDSNGIMVKVLVFDRVDKTMDDNYFHFKAEENANLRDASALGLTVQLF